MSLMERNLDPFSDPDDYFNFDDPEPFNPSSLYSGPVGRSRLDSEYLWEGEGDIYDDIVASTEPA